MNTSDQANHICNWLRRLFADQGASNAVIAVSGGIDSAVSLTLLTRALGTAAITPLLLPYGNQDMSDARTICRWNGFADQHVQIIDIAPIVSAAAAAAGMSPTTHQASTSEQIRFGNLMARSRMLIVYDWAKKLPALVCGTENKSEHYLGYFTRFGDAACDLEPIAHLYKTEVRSLAASLGIPDQIITKPPSAGLWFDQTDETELGFTYNQADQVLAALVDQRLSPDDISITGISPETVRNIVSRVRSHAFKHDVPYYFSE